MKKITKGVRTPPTSIGKVKKYKLMHVCRI